MLLYHSGPSPTGSERTSARDLELASAQAQVLDSAFDKFASKISKGNDFAVAQEQLGSICSLLSVLEDKQHDYLCLQFEATEAGNAAKVGFYQKILNGIAEQIESYKAERRQIERNNN
jgi:hypothetical protein